VPVADDVDVVVSVVPTLELLVDVVWSCAAAAVASSTVAVIKLRYRMAIAVTPVRGSNIHSWIKA
jgi:hypothetical protein